MLRVYPPNSVTAWARTLQCAMATDTNDLITSAPATRPRLAVVVALPGEARPLIDHLRVTAADLPGYRAYANDTTIVVQTGVGKLAAAGAVAALLAHFPETAAIVNVGLCGASLPRSSVTLAHTVVDSGSQRRWYPQMVSHKSLESLPALMLTTYDKPETLYLDGHSADMEASGVLVAATRLRHLGLVQFIKVVSDNSEEPFDTVQREDIPVLTACALPALDVTLAALYQRIVLTVADHTLPADASLWLTGSTTETHQLQRQLHQYMALTGSTPEIDLLRSLPTAASRIAHLTNVLNSLAPDYPPQ